MILECPGCSTRFLVNPALIPPEGREVRCAKCAWQWHVDPEEKPQKVPVMSDNHMEAPVGDDHPESYHDEQAGDDHAHDEPARVDALPNMPEYTPDIAMGDISVSLPTVAEASKPPLGAMMALACVLVLGVLVASLFAFRSSLQPAIPFVYDLMGMPRTDGLVLADVEMRQRALRSRTRYIVEGKIINEADAPRAIPALRIALVDKQGEWVLSREYETDQMLEPGASFPFKATNIETTFSDRVDHILLDLGNNVELMLRK